MKFLHTGDWHLGRTVRGHSREAEHQAVLAEILGHVEDHQVDCVLVAGDIFDSAAPPPEAERLAYEFCTGLYALGVPAVLIAGNHDHPRRIDAVAPLLEAMHVHAIGRLRGPEQGGVTEVRSRDGSETAVIAALPWVSERDAVDFTTLGQESGQTIGEYAARVQQGLNALCTAFRPETVNILVSHLFIDEAEVGAGGGERPLSITRGIYGITRQMLPVGPQYTALGHVHRAQAVRASPPAWYSGSPLQQDFGEARQDKFVNLVECHPRRPAEVTQLAMHAGRALIDVGSSQHGVRLSDLEDWRARAGDAWLRVFVEMDDPVANLPAVVRGTLENAVHVERVRHDAERSDPERALSTLGPEELFTAFYRSELGPGHEPTETTLGLFRELLQEEMDAAATP